MNSKHLVSENKLDERRLFIGELGFCVALSEFNA